MNRYLGLLSICLYLLFLHGCAIVTKQEWSKNYASIEGVRATNAKMIDGNTRTFGETAFRGRFTAGHLWSLSELTGSRYAP